MWDYLCYSHHEWWKELSISPKNHRNNATTLSLFVPGEQKQNLGRASTAMKRNQNTSMKLGNAIKRILTKISAQQWLRYTDDIHPSSQHAFGSDSRIALYQSQRFESTQDCVPWIYFAAKPYYPWSPVLLPHPSHFTFSSHQSSMLRLCSGQTPSQSCVIRTLG